jgi:hypothetical protein
MLSINPSVTQVSMDELFHCTDLVAILVRTSIIPSFETASLLAAQATAAGSTSPSSSSTSARSTSLISERTQKSPYASSELNLVDLLSGTVTNNSGTAGAAVGGSGGTFEGFADYFVLAPEDLYAFLNRVYLEESVAISAGQTSAALQHVCWSRGSKESLRILDFLAEKIIQFTSTAQGVNLNYRCDRRIDSVSFS